MERIAKEIFSMRMMVVALFLFLVSIGLATFVETVHDTQTAKIMVYNALWFTLLLIYLGVGLIANIFRYKMFRPEKIAMLTFHVAFLIMLIGAAVTRFVGFEGMMMIREGKSVDYMYSSDPYLTIKISNDSEGKSFEALAYMSEAVDNSFTHEMDFIPSKGKAHKGIQVSYVDFQKNMVDSLVTNRKYKETAIGIATTSTEPEFIEEGGFTMSGDLAISYMKDDAMPGVHIWREGNRFKMKSVMPLRSLPMSALIEIRQSGGEVPDSMYSNVLADSVITLEMATLYNVQGNQFVFSKIKKNTRKELVKAPVKDAGLDYLTVKVKDGNKTTEKVIRGGMRRLQDPVKFELNGLFYEIGYGSTIMPIPFKVKCRDFQLDRYPGSNAPSSFASELTIIDGDYQKDKRLFMNHVVDYKGYRIFQSSYDPDEKGTILSVNNDWWGTNISYLGYLLMGLGMVLSMFAPYGRMRELFNKLSKKGKDSKAMNILLVVMLSTSSLFAQTENQGVQDTMMMQEDHSGHDHSVDDHSGHNHETGDQTMPAAPPMQGELYIMTEEHSEELASLLVLDRDGRFMPIHTLCVKILRKLHRAQNFEDYNAVQTVMSMHMYPNYWAFEPIVYVSTKGDFRKDLGVETYASFMDLVDQETGDFIFAKLYEKAHRMKESERGEREKQVIKLQERFEILLQIFSKDWGLIKLLPKAGDNTNSWVPILHHGIDSKEFQVSVNYFGALNEAAMGTGSYEQAEKNLEALKEYQRQRGGKALPSESAVKVEISYNKMNIFKNAAYLYLIFGFLLLVTFFVKTLTSSETTPKYLIISEKVLFWILTLTFIYHGVGVGMRSYISGNEPWSNGYEALVFIAWVMVGTGVSFSRWNKVILGAAAMLAFFLLFVSEMNLLDPEITTLQPVLKSYWLMIHVAIITSSYAPLGVASILGLVNLILYVFRKRNSENDVSQAIREITYINEILITIGVVMLTIGTFLGGIWANESWGRYWGWDPKETWALVAILAYAVVLHLRYIPGVKDKFTFNTVAFWGYATILFTFFGVNFYLVGLHSYANGEGLGSFPDWLKYLGVALYLFTEIAAYKNQKYLSKNGPISTKYMFKKLTILFTMIIGISILILVFKVSTFVEVAQNAGIILGLIAVTNAIMFAIGKATAKSIPDENTLDYDA